MSQSDKPAPPKDGFDLIEYPCDYAFKAMCRSGTMNTAPSQHVQELVLRHVSHAEIVNLNSNSSRTGKFESVTVTIRLHNRQQLESIYQALADSDDVLMTL